ncbi:hypothetical protein HDU96_008861 [Phlyctochytrium bullatum]|nr:hypothetical protein HDU96_008861 [Phlyctochytrium bullatum]
MIRPSIIERFLFFYPSGNTPANSLVQSSALEDDLVLFTVYSDSGAESNMARKLDFTCCDFEAEIVARNVLLLSMIMDGAEDYEIMWNIYYDQKLDDVSLKALYEQAKKVLVVAETTESWRNSSYGKVIRFCDASTLERVLNLWKIYAVDPSDATAFATQQKTLKARFDEAIEARKARLGESVVLTRLRSTSPAELKALKDLVLEDRVDLSLPELFARAKHFNPMYATSSEHITLHYALDPVVGYHLSTALAELDKSSTLRPPAESNAAEKFTSAAKLQFTAWAKAFRASMSRVIVRYSFSDALAFCHVLQYHHTTLAGAGWYRTTFTFDALVLDPAEYAPESKETVAAPTTFNVIDTSNLLDHLGCLNLFAAASPLLKPDPSSVFFTEILVKPGKTLEECLQNLLIGDSTTMALLLGLVPVEYWTGATSIGRSDMFEDESPDHYYGSVESLPKHTRASLVTVLQAVKNLNAFDWNRFIEGFLEIITQVLSQEDLFMAPHYFHELFVQLHICGLLPNFNLSSMLGLGAPYYPDPVEGPFAGWQPLPPVLCVTLEVSRKSLGSFIRNKNSGTPVVHLALQGDRGECYYPNLHMGFGTIRVSGQKFTSSYAISVEEDPLGWNGKSSLLVTTMVPTQFVLEKADLGVKIRFQLRASPGTLQNYETHFGRYPESNTRKQTPVDDNGKLHLRSLHRVNPALLPAFSVSPADTWLNTHITSSLTDAERAEVDSARMSGGEPADLKCRLKESIHILFMRYTGMQGGGNFPAFYLQCESQGGINAALLISALRLDTGNQTVILDAAAIPLSMDTVKQAGQLLSRIQACAVKLTLAELTLWKHLLPAFAERCRGYPHLASCEYQSRQRFPLSTAMGDSILCSCGLGKFPSTFVEPKVSEWKKLKKFAVRVAIPVCFSVPTPDNAVDYGSPYGSYPTSNGLESMLMDTMRAMGFGNNAASGATSTPVPQKQNLSQKKGACNKCGSTGELKQCSKCKVAEYCSRECQVADWKEHKKVCAPLAGSV